MKWHAPHRIARLYYGPRVLGFALAFIASLFLFIEGQLDWGKFPFAVALFLAYPHLVYLRSCLSRASKETELQHLILDALLLGAWTSLIGFNVGLGFALLAAVVLNNAMIGGLRGLVKCLGSFALGATVVGALMGWPFSPLASPLVTTLGLLGILVYMTNVALLFYRQNLRLMDVLRENDERRVLFESLAAAGLASAGADSLEDILDSTLDPLGRVLQDGRGFGIVVRDRNRTRVVYCATFRGVSEDVRRELMQQAQAPERGGEGGWTEAPGDVCWSVIGRPTNRLEALFVIRGRDIAVAERHAIAIFLQQTAVSLENYTLTQRLTELASTDGLTGLANRTRLDEYLSGAIQRKQRDASADFSVIVADVNALKALNDAHGHEAGDRLILAAAGLLRAACRDTDLVARSGGDEFVVVCMATRLQEAEHLITRLRERMRHEAVAVMSPDGRQKLVPLSISLGCADSSECSPQDVMKKADQRMYADKEAYYRGAPSPLEPAGHADR